MIHTFPLLHPGLFQFCYVTLDIDAGMQQLRAMHGIDRFRIKRNISGLPGMPAMQVHQAHVYVASMQIELIQPAGGEDTIYRDFCTSDGTLRLHHLGLWIDDAQEYAALRPALEAQGVPLPFEIVVPNVGRAVYADLRKSLGHYVEYVHLRPEIKGPYYADVPRY